MARLKLGDWESVITDCRTCLGLAPQNMKAHYYLSQAQLSIGDFDSALTNALAAHKICATTNDKSLGAITNIVLRCKKDRWEDREKKRLRQERELEEEMLEMLVRDRNDMLKMESDEIERSIIGQEADEKMKTLRNVFENAREQSLKRREVPDWAVDDISFAIMVDPVVVSHVLLEVRIRVLSLLTLSKNRQKLANLTNAPPSWSISAAILLILSPANRSASPSFGPISHCARPALTFWKITAGLWTGSPFSLSVTYISSFSIFISPSMTASDLLFH